MGGEPSPAPGAEGRRAREHQDDDGYVYSAEQIWNWDGNEYDLTLRLTEQRSDNDPIVHEFHSRYYAVELPILEQLLREAGFAAVARRDQHFFQPLLVAINAPARNSSRAGNIG